MAAPHRTPLTRRAALGRLATAALTAALTMISCVSFNDPPAVTRVDLSAAVLTMRVGESTQIRATPYGRDGLRLSGVTVGWSSSAPDVVGVDVRTGRVDALKPGQATVRATARGRTGDVPVTVIAPP